MIDEPGWPQATHLCEAYGGPHQDHQAAEELEWNIDLDELDALVTPKTKLIFLNSPNNPTGAVFTDEDMRRICEIARKMMLIFCQTRCTADWSGRTSFAGRRQLL